MLKWCCLRKNLAALVNTATSYSFAILDTAFFNEWGNFIGETLVCGGLINVANEQFYTVHNLNGLPLTVS